MSTIDKIIQLSEVVLASLGDDGAELSVLSDLVSNPAILSLTTHLLARLLAKREERLQQSDITSPKTFIPASENPILKEWFDTAVNVLSSEAFAEIADKWIIVRILLSTQEGRDQIPDLLLPHINSDYSIDAIAYIFIGNETDSTMGISVACKNEYLSKLGEPGIIRARAESRLSDPLVQANKRLFAIYKSIVQQQKIYVENVNLNIKKYEEMIVQINTLLEKFSTASGQKSDKLVFYNENTELNEVLKTKQALVYEIGTKREQLVNYENTIKKNSSILNIKNTQSINGKLKLVFPLLFIFGFVCIRLFLNFYKKQTLKAQQNQLL
jgi:hypothetical protein